MKAIKYIQTTVLTVVLLFGCSEKFLDIEPLNNFSEAQYYKTQQDAIETVTSCYDPIKHPGGYNINFFFLFTTFSDRGIHEQAVLNNFAFDSRYYSVQNIFTYMYKGISRCNTALEKIPQIEMDEELKARLIGEVKFLRSLYNFNVTTIYGEPPLITEVITDLSVNLTNGSRADFLARIEEDLTDAIAVLPESYPPAEVGRATKGAALALLGKTYLYFQDFEKAKQYLQQVKDLGIYELSKPLGNDSLDYCYAYQCNFSAIDLSTASGTYDSENNKESVFEIQFHTGGWEVWEGGWQADGQLTCLYFGPDGYKNLAPTAEFVDQFELAPASHPAGLTYDPRRYVTFYEPGDTINYLPDLDLDPVPWELTTNTNVSISQGYGYQKYFSPAWKSNNDPTNLRLIRYADVLLMLAEAEFQVNGSTTLALECINDVRNRVGLDPISVVTADAIRHERDVEFGFEFLRFHDLVRWSMLPESNPMWVDIEAMIPKFVKGKNEYLPLPLYEVNLSDGNLKQNPGW